MKKLLLLTLLLPLFCKAQSNWEYAKSTSAMTSKTTYAAFTDSPQKLNFPPPYDGGAKATIELHYVEKTTDVFFSVDKGQINDTVDGVTILVKFDDEKPQTYNCYWPNSGNYRLLGILQSKKFANKLLTAKKVLVQVDFYEAGPFTIPFNVEGLDFSKIR